MKGKRITEIVNKHTELVINEAATNPEASSVSVTAAFNKTDGVLTTSTVLRLKKGVKWEA